MNVLLQRYPDEIARTLAKYPADQKRSAVLPLLYLAQRELGYLTRQSIQDIAQVLNITTTEVSSVVGFYTRGNYPRRPGDGRRSHLPGWLQ